MPPCPCTQRNPQSDWHLPSRWLLSSFLTEGLTQSGLLYLASHSANTFKSHQPHALSHSSAAILLSSGLLLAVGLRLWEP